MLIHGDDAGREGALRRLRHRQQAARAPSGGGRGGGSIQINKVLNDLSIWWDNKKLFEENFIYNSRIPNSTNGS